MKAASLDIIAAANNKPTTDGASRDRVAELEAANTELLEALVEVLDYACCERTSPFWDHFDRVRNKARAATAKHRGAL